MSLTPGTRFGSYEITAPIGAGGMGEVYRAKDTKLDRDVAIKVLPESFAADADRVARFRREAKTLASLNHPNIAAIYGIEENAIVMELVEGEDLSDVISKSAALGDQGGLRTSGLPLAEALPIARQIADALEAAHEQGIVHRDLKPANIKVRADGTVKVLDFGLAKAMDLAGASSDAAMNSPTMTVRATQMGMIIGTAAYMSPEQARGRAVDRRADIWAFGVVLYEMLTGRRAFDGEDVSVTLANVIKSDPDWAALPADVPSSMRRLLRRCLEKDPKKRLSAIGDARLELDEHDSFVPAARGAAQRRPTGWMALAAVASVVAIGFAVFTYTTLPKRAGAAGVTQRVQLPIFLPEGVSPAAVTVSPDGRHIAFSAVAAAGRPNIYIRSLDAVDVHPLAGGEGYFPFWSPDSRSLGFLSQDGKLRRVDIAGGNPLVLADAGQAGGAWGPDGTIVFGDGHQLLRVSASGGKASALPLDDGAGETAARGFPQFLSDGRRFLYSVLAAGRPDASAEVRVGSLDQSSTIVVADVTPPYAYSPDGRLLFMRGSTLMARRFDEQRLELAGDASPIASDAAPGVLTGRTSFGPPGSGVFAYVTTRLGSNGQLTWFDRSGKTLGVIAQPANEELLNPSLSPDGTRLAVNRVDATGNWDIWSIDLRSGITSRVTSGPGQDSDAVWSPDGNEIVFASDRGGEWGIYRKALRTGGAEQLVQKTASEPRVSDWTKSGLIVYSLTVGTSLNRDVMAVPVTGAATPIAIANAPFLELNGRVSPDGKWIAFTSNDTGAGELYVQPFPGPGERQLVSNGRGLHPRWRADGRELIFWGLDNRLMSVDVRIDPSGFHAGAPKFLFPPAVRVLPLVDTRSHYDVTSDGQRFLIRQPVGQSSPAIKVILNWAQEAVK